MSSAGGAIRQWRHQPSADDSGTMQNPLTAAPDGGQEPVNTMTSKDRSAAMRACDADRDAMVADLGEHFQAGRLTAAELDERIGQALTARTMGELGALAADLPALRPGRPPLSRRQPSRRPAAATAGAHGTGADRRAGRPRDRCPRTDSRGPPRLGPDLAALARPAHRPPGILPLGGPVWLLQAHSVQFPIGDKTLRDREVPAQEPFPEVTSASAGSLSPHSGCLPS